MHERQTESVRRVIDRLLMTASDASTKKESAGTGDDDQPSDYARHVRAESGAGNILERLSQCHQPKTPDDESRYGGEYRQGEAASDTGSSELNEAASHSSPRGLGRLGEVAWHVPTISGRLPVVSITQSGQTLGRLPSHDQAHSILPGQGVGREAILGTKTQRARPAREV